jgi:hypothetical protein
VDNAIKENKDRGISKHSFELNITSSKTSHWLNRQKLCSEIWNGKIGYLQKFRMQDDIALKQTYELTTRSERGSQRSMQKRAVK